MPRSLCGRLQRGCSTGGTDWLHCRQSPGFYTDSYLLAAVSRPGGGLTGRGEPRPKLYLRPPPSLALTLIAGLLHPRPVFNVSRRRNCSHAWGETFSTNVCQITDFVFDWIPNLTFGASNCLFQRSLGVSKELPCENCFIKSKKKYPPRQPCY